MAAALARPMPPSETRRLAQEIGEAILRRDRLRTDEAKDRDLAEAELRLASLLHRYVHRHGYRDKERVERSAQWQGALARFRSVADRALIDWLLVQIDVACNLAHGIPDLRPRKDGPTWLVLLEHVANRKRKAKAVLDWLIAADKSGGATATDKTLPEALREMHLRSASEKREP
ncbi:MAG: hypothetical protein F9K44_05240 [Hyphomicrobiaceae bacterium]|nr:MAG: hypothetical protein F9K44_05240 [Hyphomicrobiaceae bacterium]